MLAKVAFALLSAASSVLAHGNLQEIVVENPPATYVPWLPFTDSYMPTPPGRVGRKFPDNGPVEDVTSADIQCNKGAVPAALIATAAAGSQVALADAAEPAYEPVNTEVSTSAPAASSTTGDSYKVPASTAAPSTTEGSYLAPASSQDPANSYPVSDSADATEPVDGPIKTEVSTSAPAATSITDDSYKAPVSTAPSTIIDGAYKAPASPQAPTYSSGAAPATHTGGAADLAPLYAQCGGANFIPKNCVAPYICKDWNPYYSQCIGA
ncbi:unnamed protein product [Rhizoctonia solani]|uniref:lytic cellulose monooxygenase (C4-dehydrogenating) n=1 Tax=Rhizoctonia solani TaxID=456999 RepID=A0A8H3CEW0_9AGAM|nr:unnamed protein product [Rhizoctonia solani]